MREYIFDSTEITVVYEERSNFIEAVQIKYFREKCEKKNTL